MRKFRINELSSSNDGVSTSGQQHHGMQSPSSMSLVSSSTSINHPTPDALRQSLASNNGNNSSNNNNAVAANMVHSSTEPQRANQYYHHGENHFVLSHNDNINWRDEADGSEEEECRINWLPGSSDLPPPPPPPQNLQSNLFGQHSLSSNLLTHPGAPVYSAMPEQDLRTQGLNNSCPTDSARVGSSNTDKNLDSNFKEKQLRETEFCINRIEDLLSSFKNLWKTDELVQLNGNGLFDGHVNNLHANLPTTSSLSSSIGQRKPTQTVPKMINNSNAFNYSQSGHSQSSPRVSNNFGGFQASQSTIPKNTQQSHGGSAEESLRNSKNTRKLFGNNRRTVQSDSFQPPQMNETDFNEPLIAENSHFVPEGRIDQFYRLLNAQINTLHSRLEQLALSTDSRSKESYSQANPFNFNESLLSNNPSYFLCDIENCCVPTSDFHESGLAESSNDHQRRFNQQIHQLLMLQNYQINQQHKLIESLIHTQQKWIEKQPGTSFKPTTSGAHTHAHAHRHPAFGPVTGNPMFINENPLINNYRHARPDITLNNLTEPRSRANNFFDNFRSHTHQNKLQPNRESITLPTNREHQFTGGHHVNNCSNSCINMNGPCNKNSRSQFFAGFGTEGAKSQPNVFIAPNHHGATTQQQLCSSSQFSAPPSTSSMLFSSLDKKQLNTTNTTTTTASGGNNNSQPFGKTMIGKVAETDPTTHTKVNLSGGSRQSFTSPFNASNDHNNSSHKRKKTSNVNSVDPSSLLTEHHFHEEDGEFNGDEDEDDHDSIDMEPSVFDLNSRVSGNSLQNESSIFGASSSLANSIGIPTSLPSGFHQDKCSFQVPLTILPHTGAIRKKPMYDNFKFAATDNQKLSVMQNHTPKEKGDSTNSAFASANLGGIANESIRPLMPAEGRSSEQMLAVAPASNAMVNVTVPKPKLPSSSQKFSTRPPIAGAGNEASSFMSKSTATYAHPSQQDSLVSNCVLDDDIKWNQLNGSDTYNNGGTDLMAPPSSSEVDGQKQTVIDSPSVSGSSDSAEMVSRAELSSTLHLDDERLLDGSTEPKPSPSPSKSKSKDGASKCESSFLISSSGLVNSSQSSTSTCTSTTGHTSLGNHNHNNGATSAVNKSISLAETEQQQHNATNSDNNHNAANGRFLPDEVIRVNGQHQMEGDGDLEEDKDTDVRLLSLTNAVEVRSTVRLSGDGEQGL